MPYRVLLIPTGHIEADTHAEAVKLLMEHNGRGIEEYGTPRGDICELYPFPTTREVAGGWGCFLDPQDPEPFVIAPTSDEAWEMAARKLRKLEDD